MDQRFIYALTCYTKTGQLSVRNFDPDLSLNENMKLSRMRRQSELLHTSKSREYLMLIIQCLRNDVMLPDHHVYSRISDHYNEIQRQMSD